MVDKISVIRFLIEDCYKNFPELIEEIPKEEMYKILENNISAIEVEKELEGSDGLYDISERTISLASKDIDIGIEDIKKEHIELFAKLVKDNKKLYQEPDKALESALQILFQVRKMPL